MKLLILALMCGAAFADDVTAKADSKATALTTEQRLRIENSNLGKTLNALEKELADVKTQLAAARADLAEIAQRQQDQKLMADICESAGLKVGPECVVERQDLGGGKRGDWQVRFAPTMERKGAQ